MWGSDPQSNLSTPYNATITREQDGKPVEGVTAAEAEEAASLVSPYPDRTEVVDPNASIWSVWLPDYMVRYAWSDGLALKLQTGGYTIEVDYDPV